MPKHNPDPLRINELRQMAERQKAVLDTVKMAYFHGTPFNDKIPDETDLRSAAAAFIRANYELQKGLYGKVKVKLSIANLLR